MTHHRPISLLLQALPKKGMTNSEQQATSCPSDSPFSIQFITKRQKKDLPKKTQEDKFDDNIFLRHLAKKEVQTERRKTFNEKSIYKRLKIISDRELAGRCMEYFKFPFHTNIRNDKSSLFGLLYGEWLVALTAVFRNYKNSRGSKEFYVKFFDKILIFSDFLYCSPSFKEILENNEIVYEEARPMLKVSGIDICVMYDFIVNYQLNQNEKIPFILSRHKFTNGIVYETKFQEGLQVRDKGVLKCYYVIEGYLYGCDFEEYFQNDVFVEF